MYDVIIIGAGPAGITSSLYTERAKLKTLIIYNSKEKSVLEKTEKIENYYGFEDGVNGERLYHDGIKQAKNLGVEILDGEVISVQEENSFFYIRTKNNLFKSKSVILATGNKKNKPDIEGIDEFEGKGISYCAICDGFFFKEQNVAIIGNGNYAISEAKDLINIVKSITILTDGKDTSKLKELQEYNSNINIIDKKIKAIHGENKVEKIIFKDNTELKINGIFIAQGIAGSTEFAKKIGAKTINEKIKVNENMETTVKGMYACGDCTGGLYQISKAVYEGTIAGLEVIKYLKNNSKEVKLTIQQQIRKEKK